MNIFIIKTIKIRSYEMGLYFRDGEFKGLLREGRHWFVDPLGKVKVRSSRSARRGSRMKSST
jgi:hypothetical protein